MIDIEKEIDQYFKIINDAKISFDIYKGILSNAKENEKKFSKISSFLYPILNALKFSFVVQTAKLVDKREDKNIWKLIECCKQQKKEFLTEFVVKYVNEETCEEETFFLKKVDIMSDLKMFEDKLNKYSQAITNLKAQRDKIYAHNDKEYFYDKSNISEMYSVTYQDIDDILNLLFEQLNVVSLDYNRRVYSSYPSSMKDYEYIISKI